MLRAFLKETVVGYVSVFCQARGGVTGPVPIDPTGPTTTQSTGEAAVV